MSDHPSPRPSGRHSGPAAPPSRRGRRALAVVAVTAAALALGSTLPSAAAQTTGPGGTVRQELQRLVQEDRNPAALAAVTGRDGRTRHWTAGVADLETKAKVPVNGQVRAGSNTKTFVAVVVLQLVGEGKVGLDQPIEQYLPGLVRGEGIDGRKITVRQLLQHTSGLPNYSQHLPGLLEGEGLDTYYQPRTLLDIGLAHKAEFEPGARWNYSNTNYVLAGLLIEKVTGRPLAEEIERRVVQRAGLRDTYFPGVGERGIRKAHPEGYLAPRSGGPLKKVTELDPSWGGAAGQMVSTPADLNRFFTALLGGKLLGAAQLAEMRTNTVDASAGMWPGARYGLGLVSTPLSCGGLAWGHGGDIPGYQTRSGVTDDGRAVSVAVTSTPGLSAKQSHERVLGLIDSTLCKESPRARGGEN